MNILDQIRIVGTSHVSQQSLQDIKQEFLSFQPHIICIELDRQRLASLQNGEEKLSWRAIKILGLRGYIFVLVSKYFQQKIGRMVGMKPGSEMLYASELAKNNDLLLGLIDQPMNITIKRLMKKLSFKERMRFLYDITLGLIPFRKNKKIKINLAQVPQDQFIDQLIVALKKRYPNVYGVLIDERNHYMVKRLVVLAKKKPDEKILCVVGAGHKKEMMELLTHYNKTLEVV